jgi:hypothetical protein
VFQGAILDEQQGCIRQGAETASAADRASACVTIAASLVIRCVIWSNIAAGMPRFRSGPWVWRRSAEHVWWRSAMPKRQAPRLLEARARRIKRTVAVECEDK